MLARATILFIIAAVIAGCGEDKVEQSGSQLEASSFQIIAPERIVAGGCAAFRIVANEPASEQILFSAQDLSISMYRDSSCTLPIGSVPMELGTDSSTFYVESSRTGAFSLSLKWGVDKAPLIAQGTVLPSSSLKLAVEGPDTAIAGQCVSVSIKVTDEFGNPANLSQTVTLAAGFFKDASCTEAQRVTSLPFEGRSRYDLRVKRTGAGRNVYTAKADGLADGSLSIQTSPAGIRNVWMNMPRLAANQCGAALLRVGDVYGNDVVSPSDLQIQILPAGGAQFFLGENCTGTAKGGAFNVGIDRGRSRVTLYMKGTLAGNPVIRGSLVSATPSLSLLPFSGPFISDIALNARSLAFTVPAAPTSTTRTACTRLVVQLRDSSGQPVNALLDYLPLLSGSDNMARFYKDATCATVTTKGLIAKNTSSMTLYYKDISTVVGNHTADVLVSDPNGLYVAAKVRITTTK